MSEKFTPKYCLPIIEKGVSAVLNTISANLSHYSIFEIWLDYIEDLSVQLIVDLEREYGSRLIFLFRRKELEKIKMPIEKRVEIIQALHGEAYLDLDITTQMDEVKASRKFNAAQALILSYHSYKSTPSELELEEIVLSMSKLSPSVFKLSTFCKSELDALRLLRLALDLRAKGRRFIVLGMGVHGKVTRVFGTLWGNEFLFAPEESAKASAPGQLTRSELEAVFNILGRN